MFFSCHLDQRCLFMDTGLSYSQTFPQDTISLASLKKLSLVFSEIKGKKGPSRGRIMTSLFQFLL